MTGVGLAPLQFGIFDWLDRNTTLDLGDLYEQRLTMLEYADRAGFYCYHLAEHQGTPLNMAPSPGIFLAAASQRTRRIHLGPLVYLLPLYNPVRLVGEICMLDHLTRGRLELGVGRGVSPFELALFNVDSQESRAMFQEALSIIIKGLTTGEVTYEGKYFSFKNVPIPLRPLQRPYPGLWYPTSNVDSIPFIAKEGFNTILHYLSLETIREQFHLYRRIWEEHRDDPDRLNRHVSEPKLGVVYHVYVAETDAQALREAKAAFTDFFANFSYMGRTRGAHDENTQRRLDWQGDFEARLADGWYLIGSPATVREQVKEHVAITGCNYIAGAFAFGTLSTDQIMRSLHLFATEVMSAFTRRD